MKKKQQQYFPNYKMQGRDTWSNKNVQSHVTFIYHFQSFTVSEDNQECCLMSSKVKALKRIREKPTPCLAQDFLVNLNLQEDSGSSVNQILPRMKQDIEI